jgi:hypothetical protein
MAVSLFEHERISFDSWTDCVIILVVASITPSDLPVFDLCPFRTY